MTKTHPGKKRPGRDCLLMQAGIAVMLILLLAGTFAGTACAADVSWKGSGTAEDPYLISDAADLKEFSAKGQTCSFADTYFRLTNDIIYNDTWESLGPSAEVKFSGHFDGNGHTIFGLQSEPGTAKNHGFIYLAGDRCTIENLTLSDCSIIAADDGESVSGVGGLIGRVQGADVLLKNCSMKNSRIAFDSNDIGGIVGFIHKTDNSSVALEDCAVEHCEIVYSGTDEDEHGGRIGGLVGCANYPCTLKNCTVKYCRIGTECGYRAGGLVGCSANIGQHYENCSVFGCQIFVGDSGKTHEGVMLGSNAGGLLGGTQKQDSCSMTGCSVKNSVILASKGNAGGIVGIPMSDSFAITSCEVESCTIAVGESNAGGLCGHAEKANIKDCSVCRSAVRGAENVGLLVGLEDAAGSVTGDADNVYTKDIVLTDENGETVSTIETANLTKITKGYIGSAVVTDIGRYGEGYGCVKTPVQTAGTPLPVAGVLAGLCAAALFTMKRRG